MKNITAHAVRNGKSIEVTISGTLPNTCYSAKIEDIYPGGSRVYIVDPGAAQVFIDYRLKPGSSRCLMITIPWGESTCIPSSHTKVEIFVNNNEVIEVPVTEPDSEFIVIALTGTKSGCSIIPEGTPILTIYSQVFGPASYADCAAWISNNCAKLE